MAVRVPRTNLLSTAEALLTTRSVLTARENATPVGTKNVPVQLRVPDTQIGPRFLDELESPPFITAVIGTPVEGVMVWE